MRRALLIPLVFLLQAQGSLSAVSLPNPDAKGLLTLSVCDDVVYAEAVPVSASRLIKTGRGEAVLTFPSDFTGLVEIREGVLNLSVTAAIGKGSSIRVSPGASLKFSGELSPRCSFRGRDVTIAGEGFGGQGAIVVDPVSLRCGVDGLFDKVSLSDDASVCGCARWGIAEGTLNLNGHCLRKKDGFRLVLSGGTKVEPGIMEVCSGALMAIGRVDFRGEGSVRVASGASFYAWDRDSAQPFGWMLDLADGACVKNAGLACRDKDVDFSGPVRLTGDAVVECAGLGRLKLSGVVSGAGRILKRGSRDLCLAGRNTWTGGAEIACGTLVADGPDALPGFPADTTAYRCTGGAIAGADGRLLSGEDRSWTETRLPFPETALKPSQADVSDELSARIANALDGAVIELPAGDVFLAEPIRIRGRRNLTIKGTEATRLVLHFSPWGPIAENNGAFVVEGCEGIRFEGFRLTTDNPVNASGWVVSVDLADNAYEVVVDDAFPVSGWEHFYGADTFDETGLPDYALETYDYVKRTVEIPDGRGGVHKRQVGVSYKVVGPQRIRVRPPNANVLKRIRVGHRVLYRYIIYGSEVFVLRGCRRTSFADVGIERCASVGIKVWPDSEDLTLERFRMCGKPGDPALFCANADGVHILGLSGKLVMRDCFFRGLGDDALNVHSKSGIVMAYDASKGFVMCGAGQKGGKMLPLDGNWAKEGDALAFYDATTMLEKCRLGLVAYACGRGEVAKGTEGPAVGDFVANVRHYPSVEISGCHVENGRARGFLLQSSNMTVSHCTFRNLSLPGVLIAPDLKRWHEAGPSENVSISDCRFERCAMNRSAANLGAVVVKTSHDAGIGSCPPGVHRNIRISGNAFQGCGSAAVFAAAVDGLSVYGNDVSCGWASPPKNADPERRDIRMQNCITAQDR